MDTDCNCCPACILLFTDEEHKHEGLVECAEGIFLCKGCAFYAQQDGITS